MLNFPSVDALRSTLCHFAAEGTNGWLVPGRTRDHFCKNGGPCEFAVSTASGEERRCNAAQPAALSAATDFSMVAI